MMKRLLLGAALLAAAPVVAGSLDCCMDGEFEVGAQALYWRAHHCPTPIGRIQLDGGLNYISFEKAPSYDWGVRVFGKYSQDCFFLGAHYTWYEGCTKGHAEDAEGRIFTPYGITLNQSGAEVLPCTFASTNLKANYQDFDVRLGYSFCRNCKGELYGFANVRWVDLEYLGTCMCENDILEPTASATLRTDARTDGAGLGVGIGGHRAVWCGFGIFGDAGLMGLCVTRKMPDFDGTLTSDGVTINTDLDYPNLNGVILGTDFRVGLDYTYQCGCWGITAEIGYEMNYFLDAVLDRQDLPGDCTEPSQLGYARHCFDLGFGGLFFGVGVTF